MCILYKFKGSIKLKNIKLYYKKINVYMFLIY